MPALKQREPLTKREAEKRTAELRRESKELESGMLHLVRGIEKAVQDGVPAALGMRMRDWLAETFEYSASYLFEQVSTYRQLKGIPESTLRAIPVTSAHELAKLAPKDQKDPQLLQKAREQSPKEFKATVAEIRETKYHIPRDEWATFARRLPVPVYDALCAAEAKVAAALGLSISQELREEDFKVWLAHTVTAMEAIAVLINALEMFELTTQIEGDEGNAFRATSSED